MNSKRLKELRLKHKLTQAQAAKLAMITQDSWGRIERGVMKMSPASERLFLISVGEYELSEHIK